MTMLIAPQMTGPLGLYNIKNAALFDGSTAKLTLTPGTTGDQKTFIIDFGLQLVTDAREDFCGTYIDGSNYFLIYNDPANGHFRVTAKSGGATIIDLRTVALYRDLTGATINVRLEADTTQVTASDRVKLKINGEYVTSFSVETYPAQNADLKWNGTTLHNIGESGAGIAYSESYFSHFVCATSGTVWKTDAATGNWIPTPPNVTYGSNGVNSYLDFTNGANLGEDSSGNGNDWAVNGTITQVTSTPTNVYCTLNPLAQPAYSSRLLQEGNLKNNDNDLGTVNTEGTLYFPLSGSYEFQVTAFGTATEKRGVGIYLMGGGTYWYNGETGAFNYGGSGVTWTNGDVIKVRVENGEIEFFKNGASQGVSSLGLTGHFTAWCRSGGTGFTNYGVTLDCGQNGFTPSVGYKTLCTDNLPAVTGKNVNDHFKTVLYTGDGVAIGSGGQVITGVGFQPDFVWIKNRDQADGHQWFDAARGATNYLQSNNTNGEGTDSESLASFDSDGFTVGSAPGLNTNTEDYVAWCAKLPNTKTSSWSGSPSITPFKEIYNPTLGMSIVTYTGNGATGATLPHSLGAKPGMIVVKNVSAASNWYVYHSDLGATKHLTLHTTNAASTSAHAWNDTEPTSQLFTVNVGTGGYTNNSGDNYVAYIFAESDFIKIGSYTGNGNADGPFVNKMLSSAFILGKADDVRSWFMLDSARDTTNPAGLQLYPDLTAVESVYAATLDFTAAGPKIRTVGNQYNRSGYTFIYMMIGQPTGGRNTSPAPAR